MRAYGHAAIISTVSDAGFHLKGAEIRAHSSRCNPASVALLKGTGLDLMCNVTQLLSDLSGHIKDGCSDARVLHLYVELQESDRWKDKSAANLSD